MSAVRGARLVEGTRELLCERLALGGLHGPHGLLKVDLVGHEDDGDVLRGPHLRDQAPVLHGLVETVSAMIPSVTRGSSIFNFAVGRANKKVSRHQNVTNNISVNDVLTNDANKKDSWVDGSLVPGQ